MSYTFLCKCSEYSYMSYTFSIASPALSKLLKCEGGAGAEGPILPYVGHLQLISTLQIGADCCQHKLTKPNLS